MEVRSSLSQLFLEVCCFLVSHQSPSCVPLLPNACFVPCQSYPRWLGYSINIWRRGKLWSTLLSVFYNSLSFRPSLGKMFFTAPVLKYAHSMSGSRQKTEERSKRRCFTYILSNPEDPNTLWTNCFRTMNTKPFLPKLGGRAAEVPSPLPPPPLRYFITTHIWPKGVQRYGKI